jgi:hypothetical protein
MPDIDLLDILKLAGFDPTVRTKLVRHQDKRYSVLEQLRHHGWLELYQSYQGPPVFHNAEQIVSFYGLPGTQAGFYGVYRVLGHRPASEGRILTSCDWSQKWNSEAKFFYDLEPDARFEYLRDRLIIDWGLGALAWVRNLPSKGPSKRVLEIQAPGRRLSRFEDYLEFSLTYQELKDLFENEDAHQDWRASLKAVGGIYLILAQKSGDMYVGSASGVNGIWGRWSEYCDTSGHGNNKQLRDLIQRSPDDYPEQFRFSLLQILPKTMARSEVIERETRYKAKLGSRAIGLNEN